MAELIALGRENRQRWLHTIAEGETVLLGRAPRNGFSVPWDRLISREHAHLRLTEGKLCVRELTTAGLPILFDGHAAKEFEVEPDGEFQIGDTTFRFEVRVASAQAQPTVLEHTLGDAQSPASRFDNASACLEILCQMPGLISDAHNDADYAAQVVDLLLKSLRGSQAAAVMQFEAGADCRDVAVAPKLIRWNSRDAAVEQFRPSRRLICRAFDEQQSVVHLWAPGQEDDPHSHYTIDGELEWAICTPIPTFANQRWCLYVAGRRQFAGWDEVHAPKDLLGDLRLAELMARFIGAVRHVRVLEHHQTEMRQFFSPAVVETLVSDEGAAALEPRQGPVSVLFCDVRGFSKMVEASSHDLHALLARVREALSVMTRNILKHEGVIADFQGDAALGFWGWPSPSEDAPLLASRAALAIHHAFAAAQCDVRHPLYGFEVGIGVSHGEAIAGRIGSDEQIKVGVFGPVVNLASRLQDLTKQVGAPILVDAATAEAIAAALPAGEASCRRVMRLRPAGIDTPVDVYALAPGGEQRLNLAQRRAYDQAADAVATGDWRRASRLLERLPADDGPANFLRRAICQAPAGRPVAWGGALSMPAEDRAVVLVS